MKGTTVLVALLVVAGFVAIPAVGAVIQEDTDDEADSVQTGDRIAGVMGVQEAELEGELERHAYQNALERADNNATKAAVIAERVEAAEARLEELEERKAELDERRESGEISESRYRAEIARLSAEANVTRGSLERSESAAAGLPEDTLAENGVNVAAIRELRGNADELNGPEVSEIARSVTGDNPGAGPRSDNANDNPGDDARENPRGDGENQNDRSDDRGDGDGGEDGEDEPGNESGNEGDGRSGDPGNSSDDG